MRPTSAHIVAVMILGLLALTVPGFAQNGEGDKAASTGVGNGGRSSSLPIQVDQSPAIDPTATLKSLDEALRNVSRRLDDVNSVTLRATQQAVASFRLNTNESALVVPAPDAGLGDVSQRALSLLISDRKYVDNFSVLARLHLSSVGHASDEDLRIPLEQPDGGQSSTRVVGNIAQARRPFVVAVYQHQRDTRVPCTGILVTSKFVITALHCACGSINKIPAPTGLDRIQFTNDQGYQNSMAVDYLYSFNGDRPTRYGSGPDDAKKMCTDQSHDNTYIGGDPLPQESWGHDFIVAELSDNVPNDFPAISVFATPAQFNSAHIAMVAGFGQTDPADPLSQPGKFAWATVIALASNQACTNCDKLLEFVGGVHPVIMDENGKSNDTCHGDSGGPVFLVDKGEVETAQKNKTLTLDTILSKVTVTLVGITSRALAENGNCGSGGIYEFVGAQRVRSMLSSINVVTSSKGSFVPY